MKKEIYSNSGEYYCTKCKKAHHNLSKIGLKHKIYERKHKRITIRF